MHPNPLLYDDPIYGSLSFSEPVLLDLLGSQAVQRLRQVLQHGSTALLGLTKPITRQEHSIGAMILVRGLGASLKEQIAALLHDISHTAFSHVIDFVFAAHGAESYHEQKKRHWVSRSDLPAILGRYGLDWEDFLADEPFPLLEQPSPRLCADRLDYFLRDAEALGIVTREEIRKAREDLVVSDGRIAVRTVEVARWLGYRYLDTDEASWSNPGMLLLYELTARAIRSALTRGVLREEDLWTGDVALWKQLQTTEDEVVARDVALLVRRPRFAVDEVSPTIQIQRRVRTIDPDVLSLGRLQRLSEIDPEFRQFREEYIRTKPTRLSLRIVE